ncbi:MAG: methylmalonyl Co-A mutase-associated GTPase MeaB [Candidatus Dadabacteria bacterium]|nr:methylmalonyl Co-A mutase-associated GTPase MeaB [Candidatus Dadabacteria bacterium]NIT13163.1 methylmalonyl Co-A mutase-associated GTPase MeaB [Candidatus Dadabacteria bacterium]
MNLTEKDKKLIDNMLKGDRASLARLISRIENQRESVYSILKEISPHAGNSYTVGITGPPGAGKSTFVSCLTALYREQGKKVGVIAVDPTSPFTGGAVLGDRIRMQDHTVDKDVFIRSIGSRGSHGGLSAAAAQIVKLYDAYGFDITIIESVGVGQTELDIIKIANTVIVILVPESGDVVQTMKAGLMEIADIFVVNKADREGAEKISAEIKNLADHKGTLNKWDIPVLLTVASKNEGIKEVAESVEKHKEFLQRHDLIEQKLKQNREAELLRIISEKINDKISTKLKESDLKEIVKRVRDGSLDAYEGAGEIISKLMSS